MGKGIYRQYSDVFPELKDEEEEDNGCAAYKHTMSKMKRGKREEKKQWIFKVQIDKGGDE